jgi:four helix bundle protein
MSDRFPHYRLDAYWLSIELGVLSKEIADRIPRGYRRVADQLIRSGPAVGLLTAEGANRWSVAQKRQRFIEALGECGEAAATVQMAARMGLVSVADETSFLRIADRVAATLTGLIKRLA